MLLQLFSNLFHGRFVLVVVAEKHIEITCGNLALQNRSRRRTVALYIGRTVHLRNQRGRGCREPFFSIEQGYFCITDATSHPINTPLPTTCHRQVIQRGSAIRIRTHKNTPSLNSTWQRAALQVYRYVLLEMEADLLFCSLLEKQC